MAKPSIIILAGGKGTRLGKLTKDIPKPMVDVCGKPFLHWLIQHYKRQGFRDIIISTGHNAGAIYEYRWPPTVVKVHDFLQKGTDQAVIDVKICEGLTEGFWVVNGDTFIPHPLPNIYSRKHAVALSCGDLDAGAQFIPKDLPTRVDIVKVKSFYDIGTPKGLKRFRRYFKTQLDKS